MHTSVGGPSKSIDGSSSLNQIATKYFLSCTSALVAETVTYPLDITKTRLQIAKNKFTRGGMIQVTYDIIRKEGAMALWTGVAPAITRHYIYTGIRMGAYEWIRGLTFHPEKEKSFPIWKSMLSGAGSGLVAQFAASPTDLVKVQMQMEGLRRLQNQPLRYTGAWNCFVSLYRTQGFFGLWIGWLPNCQRAALLNMADIATYDNTKHALIDEVGLKDNWITHAIASACAGLAAAIVSLPSDVVKTRMMDQIRHELDAKMMKTKNTHVDLYNGVVDCYMKIIRNEGFFSLYKGFLPSYIRMAPCSTTRFASNYYDAVIVGGGLVGNAMACALGSNKQMSSKKILLLESNKESHLSEIPQPTYSNRVSAVSPRSVELFKKLDVWDRISSYRAKKINSMQVLDSCSTSSIHFDRPSEQEIAYVIENTIIVAALFEKLKSLSRNSNLDIRTSSIVTECIVPQSLDDLATVSLASGETFETSLLIGADGFNSKVRQAANVDYTSWNYDQSGLVATIEVEALNNNETAWQRFTRQGPVALLPLSPSLSSLVWTTTPEEAERLRLLPEDQFVDELNDALFSQEDQSGAVNQTLFAVLTPEQRFSLGFGNAHSYVTSRCALIGDAAHRVHPLAGQGVNLGWNDVITLDKVLTKAVREGADLGSITYLQEYDTTSQRYNVPIMVSIDFLNRLYRTNAPAVVLLRSLGLSTVNFMKPLKDFMIHYLSASR
ncbi:unnamed protein product [Caenorhabditis auriculariae]|uniref:Ubiquinone biosynthesis monooxygenase COQ6, mitochondrial n=1 Tax=Caenorhabditis auriculariae TaxID=2777116 RepID=A0A8S1HN08_9PELO|nr:unnamed protein product [Caenorhabditis auriculariae]